MAEMTQNQQMEEKPRAKVDLERQSDEAMQQVDQGPSFEAAQGQSAEALASQFGQDPSVQVALQGGTPLPAETQKAMEARFGADFSSILVHDDEGSAQALMAMGALAFAFKNHLFFAPGYFLPGTPLGDALIAHELAHFIQGGEQTSHKTEASVSFSESEGAHEGEANKIAALTYQDKGAHMSGGEPGGIGGASPSKGQAGAAGAALGQGAQPGYEVNQRVSGQRGHRCSGCAPKGKGGAAPADPRSHANDFPDKATVLSKSLGELADYTETQLDWANNSKLGKPDRQLIWKFVHFIREDKAHKIACRSLVLQDMVAALGGRGDKKFFDSLRAYSAARQQTRASVKLDTSASTVTEALKWGDALIELEKKPGGPIIQNIMPQKEFGELVGEPKGVETFVDYYKTCKPLLHADNGAEITSFLEMKRGGTKYKSYDASIPDVRNIHRFEEGALKAMQKNLGVTPNTKRPLTLVLHSAVDHNGAFHRDPNMTEVFENKNILALMIEGPTSLAAARSQIKPYAEKYGVKKKLDQVMIAGHGDSRLIELGGDIDESTGQVKHDNVETKDPESEKLFAELIKYMDPASPNHRVVFNACLTNSNSVDSSAIKSNKIGDVKREVRKFIKDNASLATHFANTAKSMGKTLDSRGANASIGQVDLITAGGQLQIYDADDPKVMADKIDYVKEGTEPGGVMRAVVQTWAENKTPDWENALKHRQSNPTSAWDETMIQSLISIALANKGNFARLNATVDAADALHHVAFEHDTSVWAVKSGLSGFTKSDAIKALTDTLAIGWGAEPWAPLVLQQVWIGYNSGKVGDVMGALNDAWFKSCSKAKKFLDLGELAPHYTALMGVAGNARAKNMLALLLVEGKNANAAARKHLTDQAKANGNRLPPAVVGVLGHIDEDDILVELGLKAPDSGAAPVPSVTPPDPPFNVDTDRSGSTDARFEPIGGTGLANAATSVFKGPNDKGSKLGKLTKGQSVKLVGKDSKWYMIEFDARVGYVPLGDLKT